LTGDPYRPDSKPLWNNKKAFFAGFYGIEIME